jgi:hypothetical protein
MNMFISRVTNLKHEHCCFLLIHLLSGYLIALHHLTKLCKVKVFMSNKKEV